MLYLVGDKSTLGRARGPVYTTNEQRARPILLQFSRGSSTHFPRTANISTGPTTKITKNRLQTYLIPRFNFRANTDTIFFCQACNGRTQNKATSAEYEVDSQTTVGRQSFEGSVLCPVAWTGTKCACGSSHSWCRPRGKKTSRGPLTRSVSSHRSETKFARGEETLEWKQLFDFVLCTYRACLW